MVILELFDNTSVAWHELDENTQLSDIITARELIGRALKDTAEKHKYFDFLKYIRSKYGEDYSTQVHQKASQLARTA
jgi:hypothetical protein